MGICVLGESYKATALVNKPASKGARWLTCLTGPEILQRGNQRLHEAYDLFFLEAFAHDLQTDGSSVKQVFLICSFCWVCQLYRARQEMDRRNSHVRHTARSVGFKGIWSGVSTSIDRSAKVTGKLPDV